MKSLKEIKKDLQKKIVSLDELDDYMVKIGFLSHKPYWIGSIKERGWMIYNTPAMEEVKISLEMEGNNKIKIDKVSNYYLYNY